MLFRSNDVIPVAAGIMKLTEIPEDRVCQRDLVSFVPSNTVKGIELYRDGLANVMNYIYRAEAVERGE